MMIQIRRTRFLRRFYVRVVSVGNHEPLLTSEVYNRKEDALHLAELLRSYAPLVVVIEDLT